MGEIAVYIFMYERIAKKKSRFLALRRATAQQSHCRHAGANRRLSIRRPSIRRPTSVVRPPSEKPFFLEMVNSINDKFWGILPVHDISRRYVFSKF